MSENEAKETMLSTMKYWMEQDPGFVDSLEGVENLAIKKRAREILEDSSIVAEVEPLHKSFPYMDRAVHRMDDYLFAVSMYSKLTFLLYHLSNEAETIEISLLLLNALFTYIRNAF